MNGESKSCGRTSDTCRNAFVNSRSNGAKRKHSATVRFSGSGSGRLHFQCKVERGTWKACTSPWILRRLHRGKYTIYVRATDAPRHVDSTPAVKTFRVR
jgi:hypothetical protein